MGADLPTMAFALLDGVIAVSGTLWFTAWLRGRWPRHGPLLGNAARASYATYVIHPLVLTAVMVAFASVALAPGIKFVLVAMAGIARRTTLDLFPDQTSPDPDGAGRTSTACGWCAA